MDEGRLPGPLRTGLQSPEAVRADTLPCATPGTVRAGRPGSIADGGGRLRTVYAGGVHPSPGTGS